MLDKQAKLIMMKRIKYNRVSTPEQKLDRQREGWLNSELYEDVMSGAIPFKERPQAKRLIKDIENGLIDEVVIHSIDRLGRNLSDILNTIEYLTQKNVNLISEKEGFSTLINGKVNPTATLLIGILGTVAQMERERIKERQKEGIEIAKAKGSYRKNGGHKPKSTNAEILEKHKKIVKRLKQGKGIRETASYCEVSINTVRKVNALI